MGLWVDPPGPLDLPLHPRAPSDTRTTIDLAAVPPRTTRVLSLSLSELVSRHSKAKLMGAGPCPALPKLNGSGVLEEGEISFGS